MLKVNIRNYSSYDGRKWNSKNFVLDVTKCMMKLKLL